MIQNSKTAEKQNVHKTRARKNMATKINGNSKRQQMNNKPIVDSFHTDSYNNKKTITKEKNLPKIIHPNSKTYSIPNV